MKVATRWQVSVRAVSITFVLWVLPAAATAHFRVVVPESWKGKVGQETAFRYYIGHPYECQITDTPAPESVVVLSPDGKKAELKIEPLQVDDFEGGKVTIQTFKFTPQTRGDHIIVLQTGAVFEEHDKIFVQDEVRVSLYVQGDKGWGRDTGTPVDLIPLTRPYGLEAGFVFKAQARLGGKGIADVDVEIEKLHFSPPKEIPEDEPLITRVVKTDVNGYLVCTLDEAGWWGVAFTAEDGKKAHEGRDYPLMRRGTTWVYVHPKIDTPEK